MTLLSGLKMEKWYYTHFSSRKCTLLLQNFNLNVDSGCQMISFEMVQAYIQYIYEVEWGKSERNFTASDYSELLFLNISVDILCAEFMHF